MRRLFNGLPILASAVGFAASPASAAERKERKIALMCGGLPWEFGPYQAQMYKLSLLLDGDESNEYDNKVYWMTRKYIPKGVYRNRKELLPAIEGRIDAPPADFEMDHLTFLGEPGEHSSQLYASYLNRFREDYGFDVLVTLMDITKGTQWKNGLLLKLLPEELLTKPL